jgi:hypothetical protein
VGSGSRTVTRLPKASLAYCFQLPAGSVIVVKLPSGGATTPLCVNHVSVAEHNVPSGRSLRVRGRERNSRHRRILGRRRKAVGIEIAVRNEGQAWHGLILQNVQPQHPPHQE